MGKKVKNTKRNIKGNRIFLIIAALPVLVFLWLIIKYSTNAPLADDFYTILSFLNNFFPAAASEKIRLLFAQHNEHRLVFSRLFTAGVDRLFGGVDFRVFLFFGGTLILLLVYSIYLSFQEKKEKLKYFLPVLFIILQPQYAGSIFWATSVLQNAGVLAFTALCLYFLARKRNIDMLLSMAFALLAVFTAANGLFLLPAGAFIYFMANRKKEGILWLIFSVFTFILYFYSYSIPSHAAVYYSLSNLSGILVFFLTLLGSAFLINFRSLQNILGAGSVPVLTGTAVLFGSGMLAWVVILVKRKYYSKNPAVFYFIIILLMTALAAALTRGGSGILQAMTSRYRIISVLMPALLYISAIELAANKAKARLFNIILAASAVFCLASYALNMKEIKACKANLEKGIGSWLQNGKGLELLNEPVQESDEILRRSIENGHYHPAGLPSGK